MNQFAELRQKLQSRRAKAGVIGLGYVGLPLAVGMVKAGYAVYGIDLDERKIGQLEAGISYLQDVSDNQIAWCRSSGRFLPTTDYRLVKELDAISICVPTPLSENQDPDTSYITGVISRIKPYMKKGILITLESTTYPGTTEELIQHELERWGYQVGKDFYLCFSPERVDPGNQLFNTSNTPKVIGGTTPSCIELGTLFYENFVDAIVPVSSPKVAEMSKLLENTFRSINIAFINEMAMMCERMDIDVWEVIKAASTKPFGFMPFYPGPGIGGHCIPLDPMYLSWKAKGFRFYSKFIDLAQSINNNMPDFIVNKAAQVLNIYGRSINRSNILILGMAYKPDIDDLRESPGLRLYELLEASGAKVEYYDPYAKSFLDKAGKRIQTVSYHPEQWKKYDCMVLATNHKCFDHEELAKLGVPIVDTRNAFEELQLPHIYKLGTAAKLHAGKAPSVVGV